MMKTSYKFVCNKNSIFMKRFLLGGGGGYFSGMTPKEFFDKYDPK